MKLLDLFSGIGGFHKGFEQAGFKFDWVGHSDIDKYANKLYQDRFKAEELGDVTAIQPRRLPDDITIVCGGFPCQSFSMAGKRKGFDDTRGTLFFEIARILRYFKELGKPIPYFVLENVKGLLNHDGGRTFATIYRVLTDLDYTIECQLLNTKWFLPQNRERIYIVGHLRGRSGSKIFPITESDGKIKCFSRQYEQKQIAQISNFSPREFGFKEISPALCARDYKDPKLVQIADYRTDEGIRIRRDGNAPCLTSSHNSENEPSRMQGIVIHSTQPRGGRGFLSKDNGVAFCLDTGISQVVEMKLSIRRLTPLECERLQGFPDNWTNNGQSDTQRYKQLGNAVSVPVVQVIAEKIKKLNDKITYKSS